jgi:hypothetical protein
MSMRRAAEPPGPEAAGYIAAWRPSSVTAEAACFARQVVTQAAPPGRERARNLLWAAAKLADYGIGLGLDQVPQVLLHPSVIERFTAHAPGLTGVSRRTLRTNLRHLARAVVPQLVPADAPLPRERARTPYTPAEIGGYLALADAQPTAARRMRAAGLICLGAGAGLIRADLRAVRGTDICRRSGGVIVTVRGARPRVVPVLARYHDILLASAQFAGECLVTGGTDPGRRNVTTPLISSLAGGTGCQSWTPPGCGPPGWPRPPGCSGSPPSWMRPGSPAASGSATLLPPCSPAARPLRWHCWGRAPGEHPAGRAGSHHRHLRPGAGDRGAPAHRRAAPPAARPHLNPGHDAHPGR